MDAELFRPADHIDPDYGKGLRRTVKEGIEVLAYDAAIDLTGIRLNRRIPRLSHNQLAFRRGLTLRAGYCKRLALLVDSIAQILSYSLR